MPYAKGPDNDPAFCLRVRNITTTTANLVSFRASSVEPSSSMTWPEQNPPLTDLILHLNVRIAGGSPAYPKIDKLADGTIGQP